MDYYIYTFVTFHSITILFGCSCFCTCRLLIFDILGSVHSIITRVTPALGTFHLSQQVPSALSMSSTVEFASVRKEKMIKVSSIS